MGNHRHGMLIGAQVSRLIPGPVQTGKWLVAIVVSLTPTANNIMVQA